MDMQDKELDRLFQQKLDDLEIQPSAHEEPVSDTHTFIYLKVDRKTIKVNINDILWIESLRDYVKVVAVNNHVHITRQKISLLEEMLPENRFVRIHRSFIVALNKIDSFYAYSMW